MRQSIILIICCMMLSSCAAMKDIQGNEGLNKIGSFQLNPVQPNNYWYDGSTYEYNEYEIKITSKPVEVRVKWNGKTIGTTPFVYRFTGTVDKGDYIRVRAVPIDENIPAQESSLHVMTELPREINFDFNKK
jgi:hypothetical protein